MCVTCYSKMWKGGEALNPRKVKSLRKCVKKGNDGKAFNPLGVKVLVVR